MRSLRSLWIFVFVLFVSASGPYLLHAQSGSASLAGTVLDQAGKAIPNASVAVKNEATGALHTSTTDAEGRFAAGGLSAGVYTIEASAAGFTTTRRVGQQVAASGTEDISIPLSVGNVTQTVTVEAAASVAAQLAPSGNTLDATSARTEVTEQFIKYFASPLADFNEVIQMAPGTFSVNSNGVGLGQGKTYFRGFSDGQYTMTFDGIPFQDTNSPTHHSWAFFPGQWIGGVDFDRSPGGASNVGPTNFGGSINLLSHDVPSSPDIKATASYGSFNTRLFDLSLDSGQFGLKEKKSSLILDLHQLLSDGYQTYNYQKRVAGSMKYQYKFTDKTVLTAFFGLIDLWTNTPDTNAPNRAQVAQFGDNYLLNGDPTSPFFYGYSFYHVQTDFGYIGLNADLGHGWRLDNKASTYRYWNKQNLEKNLTTLSVTSGVDKLNGANHIGDTVTLSHESRWGVFRTGIWYDWAYTDRYQYPSSPFTWADTITPNFHEHFITQTYQPYAEYEWRATPKLVVTAGIKDARYDMHFEQYQDNGKAVGCLGGVLDKTKTCIGGVAFYPHSVDFNKWLPSVAARYRLQRNWSVYAQFGEGSVIPPTSAFDVPAGTVRTPPKQTVAKTYQAGTVLKFNRWTLDVNAYHIHFENPYSAINNPDNQTELIYVLTGPSNTKGVEAESNIVLARGVSLYLNGTLGAAKYENTSLWVANAPRDTETVGVTWQHRNWDEGFFNKRVGRMYNDNGSVNQAVKIDPFNVSNVFVNYTVKNASFLRGSRIGLSVNNLFDNHNITGISPAVAATSAAPFTPAGGDLLTLLPGRSLMVSLTIGYAPKR
ncbi:MAG: TonB-dependent receptor [Bryobacterales bacterium]|nr:TonB-dependent receptor [Bryobacterales bacterium]